MAFHFQAYKLKNFILLMMIFLEWSIVSSWNQIYWSSKVPLCFTDQYTGWFFYLNGGQKRRSRAKLLEMRKMFILHSKYFTSTQFV